MIYPIYIPSKGRPDSELFSLLEDENLPYRVFVEPQERFAYQQWPTHQLELNDQGLSFARNAILDYARSVHESRFWMLDDDIEGFYQSVDGANVGIGAGQALESAQKGLLGAAQGGLEYSQFAWSAMEGDYAKGSYCDVCVLHDRDYTGGIYYRDEANLKEDRDFTLQVLAAGLVTRRISWISFSCPANGSNKGGWYNAYRAGKEKQAAERLAKLWPNCVTVQRKQNGRWDAKIEWRDVPQARLAFE